jgi:hypothetical protein
MMKTGENRFRGDSMPLWKSHGRPLETPSTLTTQELQVNVAAEFAQLLRRGFCG